MALNYYASSPTVVLPPRAPTHYFDSHHGLTSAGRSPSLSPSAGHSTRRPGCRPSRFPRPPSLNYLATSSPLAGRKRSRDDSADPQVELVDGSKANPSFPPKTKPEPVYGPGMTLIYPDDPGFSIAAESQTGTWVEEKNEKDEHEAEAKRPASTSRKSQRRDSNPSPRGISPDATITPINAAPQPLADAIDQLAMTLGVGWKKVPAESAAAWSKFIHNHYKDILEPVILLENEGQHAYLVKVTHRGMEQLWLFQEDLSLGQCLASTLDGAIRNLSTGDREGPVVYKRERSPQGILMPTAAGGSMQAEVDAMELA